jgi:hypothetical protein
MFEHLQVCPVDTSQKAAGSSKGWRVGQQIFSNANVAKPHSVSSSFFDLAKYLFVFCKMLCGLSVQI